MYKDVLRAMEDVAIFPTITLLLFLGFFIGLLIYLYKKGKSHYDEAANLPLESDESIEKSIDDNSDESTDNK